MTTQSQQQVEDDEISLIDILLFLKASGRNVLISTIVCFLIGAIIKRDAEPQRVGSHPISG